MQFLAILLRDVRSGRFTAIRTELENEDGCVRVALTVLKSKLDLLLILS